MSHDQTGIPDILGSMTPRQHDLAGKLLRSGAILDESNPLLVSPRVHVTPEHVEQAREKMDEDMDRRARAAAHALVDSTSEVPATREYMTAQEMSDGRRFYDWACESPVGKNGLHLAGKFAKGWVPGVNLPPEFSTIVTDASGAFGRGIYQTRDPDFEFIGALGHNLGDADKRLTKTNFLFTYPSVTNPNLVICSYGMWEDQREFPIKEQIAPADVLMSLDFAIPMEYLERFTTRVMEQPRLLEAMVLASPYGKLMGVMGGRVMRNQADKLSIVNFESGKFPSLDSAAAAGIAIVSRRFTEQLKVGAIGTLVAIDPPVGEVVK